MSTLSVTFHNHPNIPQCLLTMANKRNITFHCQQSVAMTTSHRRHREWVTLVKLHRLGYPRILFLPPEAAAGPLSPGVHLPICGERQEKKLVTASHRNRSSTALSLSRRSIMASSEGSQSGTKTSLNKENPQAVLPLLAFSPGSLLLAQ